MTVGLRPANSGPVWLRALMAFSLSLASACAGTGSGSSSGEELVGNSDDVTVSVDADRVVDTPDLDESTAVEPAALEGLRVACADAPTALYSNPDPGVVSGAPRGALFACVDDGFWPAMTLQAGVEALGLESHHGVRRLRVSYRTERASGVPGVGTASIFLPEPPPLQPMDRVVVAHGTAGLADHCAPSRYTGYFDSLSLAFVSQGYLVIAPDYAGLGNDGVQGYGDARDTAYSLLDAPAALRELVLPDGLTERVAVAGYSQGGGAALNVQGLAASYGMDGVLEAAVSVAGSVLTSTEIDPAPFQWAGHIQANYAYGASAGFGSLMLYAYGANWTTPPDPGVFFHPDYADEIVQWVESLCIGDLITKFGAMSATLMFDDIYSPDYYAGVLDCLLPGGTCVAPYKGYVERLQSGVIPADPAGAPILIYGGLLDTIVLPTKLACTADFLGHGGLQPTTCVNPSADHGSVDSDGAAHVVSWVRSKLDGAPPPDCPSPFTALPLCDE